MYTSEQRKEKTFELFKDLFVQRIATNISNLNIDEEQTKRLLEIAKKTIQIFDENYLKI